MINLDLEVRKPSEKPWAIRGKRKVPGIIHGKRLMKSVPVKIPLNHFKKGFKLEGEIYRLDLLGEKILGKITSIQRDPVTREIIHFTIQELPNKEEIRVELPIKLQGFPKGLDKGGIILKIMDDAEVEGKLSQIPNYLSANISNLDVGDVLTIRDLNEAKVDIKPDDSEVVAVCRPPSVSFEKFLPKRVEISKKTNKKVAS